MKIGLLFILCVLLTACASRTPATSSLPSNKEVSMLLSLTSSAFANGQSIPAKYSCIGSDYSPPLEWSEPPAGTKSFALIMDDPDAPAGIWVHWVLYNIPPSTRALPEHMPKDAQLPNGALQGRNSGREIGYNGPCPPWGTHRYFFKLYALDTALNLGSGASKDELLQAMQGHILAQGELMGTFSK